MKKKITIWKMKGVTGLTESENESIFNAMRHEIYSLKKRTRKRLETYLRHYLKDRSNRSAVIFLYNMFRRKPISEKETLVRYLTYRQESRIRDVLHLLNQVAIKV